ncbi:hypothetical protein BaRGS_00003253 [Batillaria attramentaria]|uniref:Centromere/kinetochore protein zw10 homolog n=1 Tax=Batillaria attramentaria TaxID=370345 RepID=A0ABD0M1F6_9CAEN
MASFVAEVLSSAGQLEREEINEKLSILGRRMEELKLDIHAATTATFTNFDPSYDTTVTLSERVKAVSTEMQELSKKIDTEIKGQLNVSTGEFQSLTRQLEQVTMVMTVLDKLTKAQQLMEDISTATTEGKFSQAASFLMVLEEALKEPVCDREEEVNILVALRTEQKILKQKLIQELNDVWKETVVWLRPENVAAAAEKAPGKDSSGKAEEDLPRQWELKLPKSDDAEQEALAEVVTAMETLGQLDSKIKAFGRQMLNNVFSGMILRWRKVIITEKSLSRGRQVVIKAASEEKQPGCVDVFTAVGSILDLLQESLLNQKVVEGIVKECLADAIPSTAKELEGFHEVIAITEKFQGKLVSLDFIPDSCRTLLDYVQNVNILFANKKCQNILEQARALMTTDIHDTVLVSADAAAGELPPLDKSGGPSREKTRKVEMAGDPLLSNATFRMPTCRVSLCVQEILDLAYLTLNEATSSSPQCAAQMFYATRNIFELFCSVFPTYHAHSLANYPQLTALHHNNCMYLAHHLLTLGHQFRNSLPKDISATFVDLIPEIRSLGTSSFLDQMNTQKAIIEQYLHGAGGFASVEEESNYSAAERAVKQALHQLTHLQKVWQGVLPTSVYHKAIGILLNTLITDIMDKIIVLEDISSDAARKLFTLLKLIHDKGGLLFLQIKDGGDMESHSNTSKVKVELLRHVPRWAKFTELQLVLNGTLQGIADRWAEGKGPLAADFTPNELKQLIRALFQNTDRRAAVLAKIK